MAEVVLSGAKYYRSGSEWYYAHVGNAMSGGTPVPSVVRYSFVAPPIGARSVSVSFTKWYLGTGNRLALRFFIGVDPTDHIDADQTYPFTGDVAIQSDGVTMSGNGEVLLTPGKTYYLWVFPAETSFGIWEWENAIATLVTSGAAGGARIGADKKRYLCAIGQSDGSKRMYLPAVYDAAAGKWKLQA